MKKYGTLLIAAALMLVYFGSIWQRPLFLPDEFRYAEIPREMIASGDWILPRQLGMPYFEKPVLGYWLNGIAELLFGESPAAVRFFPALATLLTALWILLLCRRAGEPRTAAAAPLVFLTSALVFAVGTYGVLDALFVCFLTGAMTAAYFAWSEPVPRRRAGYLVLTGVGCGLAFLTKGALAAVLPALCFLPFLLWQREGRRIFTFPWIPLLAAAAVAAPWAVAIHRADGDFWRQFLWVEHIQRAFSGEGAGDNRAQPFWFYLPVLIGGAMPWILLLPAMYAGCRGRFREMFRLPLIRFSACAAGMWFLFFTASSGKLGTYILPCFPFLAILFGYALVRYGERGVFSRANRILEWIVRLLLPVPVALFLIQTAAKFTDFIPPRLLPYERNSSFFLPVLALVLLLIWLRMAARERNAEKKFLYFCVGFGFVMLAAHGSIPPRFVVRSIAPELFLRTQAAPLIGEKTVLFCDAPLAAAAAWTLKRDDFTLFHKPGEFQYGLARKENTHRRLSTEELAGRIRREPDTEFLVLTRSEKRMRELPRPTRLARMGRFLALHYHAETGETAP